ncbi:EspA/EspE family type VII secretion system effector [Mycobacterium attenuatum]|uniref:EspA/EspE family type VII secretion system effector n=1 Tax=Mycobacterium attenuatum TaxID=2341086 RepID=UPI000F013FF1|nr:EspA/EspE family type VII secretion system effector [Mycobacterium attenuatum]VBA57816.1 ESX-1 secretion-associated protein EspA [Mycobacterium attenuatum]
MDRAWIIDSAIDTIDGFEAALGIGIPMSGDAFNTSSSWFARSAREQASAAAGDRWQGSAAEAYTAKNQLQKVREEIMADLDYITGTLVTEQADAVKNTRDVLSFAREVLKIARSIAIGLSYIPLVGQWISDSFQLPITSLMMSIVTAALASLAAKTAEDAAKLVAALWKLVELLEALIEDEVVSIVSDIEFDVRELVSRLESDLYATWSDMTRIFSEMDSGLPLVSSMTSLSGIAGMASKSGSAGSAIMPGLTHVMDLAHLSEPAQSLVGAGLPSSGQLGGSMSQMRSFPTEIGPPAATGHLGDQPRAASAQSSTGTQGAPGSVPHSASRRPRDHEANGAASGVDSGGRAPIEALTSTPAPSRKETLFVNALVSQPSGVSP